MCDDHSFELESSMQPTYLDVGIRLPHGVLILEVGNLIEVNSQNAHFYFGWRWKKGNGIATKGGRGSAKQFEIL